MTIERTPDEVIIRLSPDVNTDDLQTLIDYLSYREATAKTTALQKDVDVLARESKKNWWRANSDRLIK